MKRAAFYCAIALFLPLTGQAQTAPPISNSAITTALQNSAPTQWTTQWTSPNHLASGGFLNSGDEASSIEYRDLNGDLRATILVIKTSCGPNNPNGVYQHDYRRCSSIHGKELRNVAVEQIGGGWFHRLQAYKHLLHEEVISFLVEDFGSHYRVDSKLFASQYGASCNGNVYNFQVWSDDAALTVSLVSDLITTHLAQVKPISNRNSFQASPPSHLINLVSYHHHKLLAEVTATTAINGRFTVVAWTRPNPTPNVTSYYRQLHIGQQSVELPLLPADALATDFELYLAVGFSGIDEVLATTNHFGHYTSSWLPFSGGGSGVVIGGVADNPPPLTADPTATTLNNSTFSVNCTMPGGSFCGVFTDIFPEQTGTSLDFSGFDQVRFLAKRLDPSAMTGFQLKLETTSGTDYSHSFSVNDMWQEISLPLANFQGPAGQIWQTNTEVERITIAAVAGGSSSLTALAFSQLQITRRPRLTLSVIGGGQISVPSLNEVCDDYCTYDVPRSQTVTPTPLNSASLQFDRWIDPNALTCQSSFQMNGDIDCAARFRPRYSQPELNIELVAINSLVPNSTRFLIADNSLLDLDWNSLVAQLDGINLTSMFLSLVPPYGFFDSTFTRLTIDLPLILHGHTMSLQICRLQTSGGGCSNVTF